MWPWLIGLCAWFVRLVGGWLPIGTKPIGEWLGKILWVVGVILAINFVTDFFRPKPMNTSRPSIVALPFSTVENINQSTTQKSESAKRKWWQPIPYVSVAGEVVQLSSGGTNTGAKMEAGLRLDF